MLEPATRLKELVDLTIQRRPVIDGTVHVADMDEVKVLGSESPIKLSIVDLELKVRGYPTWLGGRNVGPDDFGRGELVSHVTGVG